jgi:hypothetical protein
VLPRAVSEELFQVIPGREPEILEGLRRIEQDKLSQPGSLEIRREPSRLLTIEQLLRLSVAEAPDHSSHDNADRS